MMPVSTGCKQQLHWETKTPLSRWINPTHKGALDSYLWEVTFFYFSSHYSTVTKYWQATMPCHQLHDQWQDSVHLGSIVIIQFSSNTVFFVIPAMFTHNETVK
jgi:hypothetical protein